MKSTILRAGLFALSLLAAALVGARPTLAAEALPGDSVYQLELPLVDQDGRGLLFADGRGRVRLVSMFYTSCRYVCPLIIDSLRKAEQALDEESRARLDVLLITLDPERDTPAALKEIADRRHLDLSRWRLVRSAPADVRSVAAVLGIQYKQLQNKEFSHSSALVLLDGEGRVLARSDRLGEVDPEFVAALKSALAVEPSAN